ncbi:MAG: hypothetical protein ACI9TH_005227, partial [Kiritimatiellia bacterium]
MHEDHLSGNLGSRYGFPLPAGKPERVNRGSTGRGSTGGWPQLSLEHKKKNIFKKEHFHRVKVETQL